MHLKFKSLQWVKNEANVGSFYASIDARRKILSITISGNEREDFDPEFSSIEKAKEFAGKVYHEYVCQFIKDHFDGTTISA